MHLALNLFFIIGVPKCWVISYLPVVDVIKLFLEEI